MKTIIRYLIVLCISSIQSVYAAEIWRNISSLQADFKQQIQGERGAIPVLYSGKIYAANNKVKWEYDKPLVKEVYLEKNVAYIYEPQLQQVTIGTLKENVDFIRILKQVKKTANDTYQTTIGNVIYSVVVKDSLPYLLSYKDSLDNNVSIVFSNVKMNIPIDSQIFIFQPPDNVEYIEAH